MRRLTLKVAPQSMEFSWSLEGEGEGEGERVRVRVGVSHLESRHTVDGVVVGLGGAVDVAVELPPLGGETSSESS